jgi:anti-anti-sigma regulatory factor
MTAGLWHQAMEVLGEGASESRPAVSIVWRLSTEAKPSHALLEMYEGPAGRSAVVELVGALGARSLQRLEQALAQVLGWGIKRLVLDFSRVTHLDYRRLPAMVALLRGQAGEGMGFAVVGLNRYLADLFRVAGVDVEFALVGGAEAVCGAAAAPEAAAGEVAGGAGPAPAGSGRGPGAGE